MELGAIYTFFAHGTISEYERFTAITPTGLVCTPLPLDTCRLDPSRTPIGLVGAGGAARTVVYALAQAEVKQIYVWNRTADKARKIAIDLRDACSVMATAHQSDITEGPDIIIGTIPGEVLPRSAFVEPFSRVKRTAMRCRTSRRL